MKHLILVILLILSVSCASSRQELLSQHTEQVSTVIRKSSSDYSSELLSNLLARLSDSVHIEMRTYYPPADSSDTIGPLKSTVRYQRKSSAAVDKQDKEKRFEKSTSSVTANDSISSVATQEIEHQTSVLKFNWRFLPIVCVFFMFIGLIVKRYLKKA